MTGMKIIHIITGLRQGGAESMLEKLVLAGRRLNPEVIQEVVVLGPLGTVGQRLVRAGIRVDALDIRSALHSPIRMGNVFGVLSRLKAPTIVQTWLWHADLLGGGTTRLLGNRRLVWNLRNSMPHSANLSLGSKVLTKACALLSFVLPAHIVCNSNAAARAHAAIGYSMERSSIIPNGFDLEEFQCDNADRERVRCDWGVGRGDFLVGMVARLDPLKDHGTFIGAAAIIRDRVPSARFVLVGDGVKADEHISELIRDSKLEDRFVLDDGRVDVPQVMSSLDVFLLSSVSEGFPNVLGEAMACEVPCVSTDVGDAGLILGDPELLAPIRSPAALAARVVALAEMGADRRRTIGRMLRNRIEEQYSLASVWARYLALYSQL